METESLKKKRKFSRLLLIAIPVLVILAGVAAYEYGYLAVQDEISSIQETENVKISTLKKYVSLIALKPELEKKLILLNEQRKSEDRKLVEGQTTTIAAAALQNAVKAAITGRAGLISSERVEKTETAGRYKLISVSIDAVIPDVKALADILYAIETQTPYLVIKELDIRSRNISDPRDMTVRMRVAALTTGK